MNQAAILNFLNNVRKTVQIKCDPKAKETASLDCFHASLLPPEYYFYNSDVQEIKGIALRYVSEPFNPLDCEKHLQDLILKSGDKCFFEVKTPYNTVLNLFHYINSEWDNFSCNDYFASLLKIHHWIQEHESNTDLQQLGIGLIELSLQRKEFPLRLCVFLNKNLQNEIKDLFSSVSRKDTAKRKKLSGKEIYHEVNAYYQKALSSALDIEHYELAINFLYLYGGWQRSIGIDIKVILHMLGVILDSNQLISQKDWAELKTCISHFNLERAFLKKALSHQQWDLLFSAYQIVKKEGFPPTLEDALQLIEDYFFLSS